MSLSALSARASFACSQRFRRAVYLFPLFHCLYAETDCLDILLSGILIVVGAGSSDGIRWKLATVDAGDTSPWVLIMPAGGVVADSQSPVFTP